MDILSNMPSGYTFNLNQPLIPNTDLIQFDPIKPNYPWLDFKIMPDKNTRAQIMKTIPQPKPKNPPQRPFTLTISFSHAKLANHQIYCVITKRNSIKFCTCICHPWSFDTHRPANFKPEDIVSFEPIKDTYHYLDPKNIVGYKRIGLPLDIVLKHRKYTPLGIAFAKACTQWNPIANPEYLWQYND